MVKFVSILKRSPDMTVEEFHNWWLGSHAAKGRKIPYMKKYIISLAADVPKDLWQADEGGLDYDGICEIWFDNVEDMRKAMTSDEMGVCVVDAGNHKVTQVGKNYFEENPQDVSGSRQSS